MVLAVAQEIRNRASTDTKSLLERLRLHRPEQIDERLPFAAATQRVLRFAGQNLPIVPLADGNLNSS